jgi:hypothetical protein
MAESSNYQWSAMGFSSVVWVLRNGLLRHNVRTVFDSIRKNIGEYNLYLYNDYVVYISYFAWMQREQSSLSSSISIFELYNFAETVKSPIRVTWYVSPL